MDKYSILCYNIHMNRIVSWNSGEQEEGVVPFFSDEEKIRHLLKENQRMRRRMHYIKPESPARIAAEAQINRNNACISELRNSIASTARRFLQG